MILGKIFGKLTTTNFQFLVEKETRKFEFVQVLHNVYDYVLCQVVEIERTDRDIAKCVVIGYKDDKGRIKPIMIPFEQNSEVLRAEDAFVKDIIRLEDSNKGAFIGRLEGKNIDVCLDLKKLLTKHVAILAKSGAGKSYTVGVLIEEIIDKKIPLLIIDPHGEYGSLRLPNDEESVSLAGYNLKPSGFRNVNEYGDSRINPDLRPLRLNNNLTTAEIIQLFPGKLSSTQLGILYSALKHLDKINFTNVLLQLEREENNSKWTIINNLEYLNNMEIFSESFIPFNELIQPGKCSIINFKGISPDLQEIIVYKLLKDLFEARKIEKIPPFFTVIEEAHNYAPERSFGETRCSKIIRTVASEGRKFGLGLCVISQRPARVDKSVLSQCTTQIILKVTNPNDIRAITNSVEGITPESEDAIINLPIGSALVTGIVDMPLVVNIRPRMSKHGGAAADMLEAPETDFFENVEEFEKKELLPIIKPKITPKDLKLMSDKEIESVNIALVPGYLFLCSDKETEYNLLFEFINGNVVTNIENFTAKSLPELDKLSPKEIKVLHAAFQCKSFTEQEIVSKGLLLDVKEELNMLEKKGYLEKSKEKYRISDKYILSQLSKHACYSKIEFTNLNYNMKLDQKQNIDKIKEMLGKFTSVKDQRECFIVRYDVVYQNK